MASTKEIKKKIISKSRFQDVVFIIGILAVAAMLVLGLFPEKDTEEGAARISFIYLMLVVPVLAAIYFIFMSFRRKLYSGPYDISSSITFKIGLAFISVAVLPSLLVIIISNNIINAAISELFTEKTYHALEESIVMSYASIQESYNSMHGELETLDRYIRREVFYVNTSRGRRDLADVLISKGFNAGFYRRLNRYTASDDIIKFKEGNLAERCNSGIKKFIEICPLKTGYNISSISIGNSRMLLGRLNAGSCMVVIYREIPGNAYETIAVCQEALKRQRRPELIKPYMQVETGILLLIMALGVFLISVSVSFFLSRNITRPVLELADAAGDVASGNFMIHLKRDTDDELSFLFDSFNHMVRDLEKSRQAMYQAQKLEAWGDVAKKLVHEIKNPLTPIRLSAERMRKRLKEGHENIRNIILSGTETIIEEVMVLMRILDEFSKFARLPEMKGKVQNINPVIENCVNIFLGHEGIIFDVELSDSVPDVYLDRSLMRQALNNILQNSVAAVEGSGRITIKTELVSNRKESLVRLRILDNGIGIQEEDVEKVFEPAFSKKEEGSGLGLAIVEKIVLEHNGKIYCFSIYGEGTEFIIDLPVIDREEILDGDDTHS